MEITITQLEQSQWRNRSQGFDCLEIWIISLIVPCRFEKIAGFLVFVLKKLSMTFCVKFSFSIGYQTTCLIPHRFVASNGAMMIASWCRVEWMVLFMSGTHQTSNERESASWNLAAILVFLYLQIAVLCMLLVLIRQWRKFMMGRFVSLILLDFYYRTLLVMNCPEKYNTNKRIYWKKFFKDMEDWKTETSKKKIKLILKIICNLIAKAQGTYYGEKSV